MHQQEKLWKKYKQGTEGPFFIYAVEYAFACVHVCVHACVCVCLRAAFGVESASLAA